jgi:glycosyltransferase involved in cell wall biosynthesis
MATALESEPLPVQGTRPLELTILMPCLDEAATIATCIAKARAFLARTGIAGEVLIADNGSTDGSVRLAERAGARVVTVAERGYGAALRAGVAVARGCFVIMGDADDSYDFARLDAFVERLRGGCDLVMGNRFAGGIAPGAMPFLHRYLGNPALSLLGRLFSRADIGDFHCGLRGFRRDAVLGLPLRASGMEFASEMVVRAALAGLVIAEVPTTLAVDGRARAPHLRTWHDGWRHLRFLLTVRPRWTFLYPGLALVLLGTIGVAALFAGVRLLKPGFGLDH